MGAATLLVITASCSLQRAASPREAVASITEDTAAGIALGASVVAVTHRWWFDRGRRRWARVGRVLAGLDGV